jgi:ribosomal protein S11
MQKQKKNWGFKKKKTYFSKNILRKETQQSKFKIRKRKIFKNKLQTLNPTFQQLVTSKKFKKIFPKRLNIRITSNNVFCTLKNIKEKKILFVGSSGIYKVKTSKKTLRYSTKVIVGYFLKKIKKGLNSKRFFVNIIAPIRIRKAVIKQLAKFFKKSSLIVNAENKKCFNGCRPKKKKRKKQKGLRIFK